MNINDRIREKRLELQLTQKQIADKVGLTTSSITQWELGSTKPTGENLYKLCKALDCTPDWLLYGKSPAFKERLEANIAKANARKENAFSTWDNQTELTQDEVELPFFREVELSAGSGTYTVQENHGAKLWFAKSTLKKCGVTPENAACVNISGTSMEPVLPDGATVGVDTANTNIKDGDIYALEHNGMLRVKIIYRLPSGGLRMRSFNSGEYPDEEYSKEDVLNVRIIGRVFWYSVLR